MSSSAPPRRLLQSADAANYLGISLEAVRLLVDPETQRHNWRS
jgi:hypothetical protein